jgi:hypothetical protein
MNNEYSMKAHLVYFLVFPVFLLTALITKCTQPEPVTAEQWHEIELSFEADKDYENPYTDVEFWLEFTGPDGTKISRPGFWYENNIWKVRFASPVNSGDWDWKSFSSAADDKGLNGLQGTVHAVPYTGDNPLLQNGLLRMSPLGRNVIHANGKSFLMIGDTPWALPWRGTIESVSAYAENRRDRGFNTALLMTLQPDRDAEGPVSRTESGGFDVAFVDLKDGHINRPIPSYFQYFDTLRNILVEHGIVPVFQPVFHGFGWKGLNVLGWDMEPEEYARYSRYLVARYGAGPAIWLAGADSDGRNPTIEAGGKEIEKWDAYHQPTGIHYSPFDDYTPDWWNRTEAYVPHQNKMFQDADWLDFQWCQTGHGGEHLTHKVDRMYNNLPVKAAANGEPTYEGIRDPLNASGWWQGNEAWLQYTSGGTMGVVYGAGGLWNWKLSPGEPGWPDWANSNVSWKEAIDLPGAVYVGYLGKALAGLDLTDIEKRPDLAGGELCLAKPGELYVVYLPEGGTVSLSGLTPDMYYRWFNPLTGEFAGYGNVTGDGQVFTGEGLDPAVLIVNEKD